MPDKNVLYFGIISNSPYIEDWKLSCIKEMQKNSHVELRLLIMPVQLENSNQKSSKLMQYFLNKRYKSMRIQNLKHECKNVPILTYEEKNLEYYTEKVKKAELDFIIDFDGLLNGGFLDVCKYGIWAFQQGNEQSYLHGYTCFWEIYNNESVTAASLYRRTSNNEEKIILKKGYYATIKDSYLKNKDNIFMSVFSWPSMVCEDILRDNAEYLDGNPVVSRGKVYRNPTHLQRINFFYKMLGNKIKKLARQLFCYEYWNVGLINQPIENLLNESQPNIDWLVKKKNLYFADPFGYEENDSMHILMEELDHKVVNGYISKANVKLVKQKEVTIHQSIIRLPSHMSYPYILQHKQDIYCIPETSEENEVVVYQLNKNNKEWLKTRTILEGFPAVDSTIIKHGEMWWLFCTRGLSKSQSHNCELHIYFSDDLFGTWKAHQQNPVKIDIRSSRPAGTPFYHEGSLYRPAQDCSETYGGRIVLNKINTLTPSHFNEEMISYVHPSKKSLYPDGVHTLSSVNNHWTLIDGKRFDYSFFHILKKLHKIKPNQSLNTENYPIQTIHERKM